MKTDELFYELFRFSPESLLELVQLDVSGPYRFESVTVKSTEKRFDGYFENVGGPGSAGVPARIWRLFREIRGSHEQREDHRPFVAVVLFIDARLDPGNPPLNPAPPNQLIRRDLVECLKSIRDNATPLVVLKPLTLQDKADLPQAIGRWKAGIDEMGLPEDRKKTLTELLEYAILQRFKRFTLEEIRKMIELTPLEDTVAGKQLIQQGIDEGMEKGMKKGMEKGQITGQIRLIERLLKRPQTPNESLAILDVEALGVMLAKLEGELSGRPLSAR
jgi:hypothetical protein